MSVHPGNLAGRPPLGLKASKPERGTAAAKRHIAAVKALPCGEGFTGDSCHATVKRHTECFQHIGAPNRNGSYEDRVMAKGQLPPIGALRQLLRYEAISGKFFWLARPANMFPDTKSFGCWNTRYAGQEAGSSDPRGYVCIRLLGTRVWAHRLAFAFGADAWPLGQVDHIDGDKSNNRLSNLRECSNAVNSRNCRLYSNNTSGRCGVTWNRQIGKWKAQGKANGVQHNLGHFSSKSEAVAARAAFEEANGFSARHGAAQ